ncbi:hypothetical protein AAFF_G00162620 [Aldrovandia affinis]|uniref:Uncharacterized protein n=1 Tax=Aldrovandia affinis TaxID=143900 RepID=A0AAD7SZ67_9TELE|nr:hypothetical protein AAFF_G00162620 [Aldrovandia affinis]
MSEDKCVQTGRVVESLAVRNLGCPLHHHRRPDVTEALDLDLSMPETSELPPPLHRLKVPDSCFIQRDRAIHLLGSGG